MRAFPLLWLTLPLIYVVTQTACTEGADQVTITSTVVRVRATGLPGKPADSMSFIPAGRFIMGSAAGTEDERPVHEPFLDAFWIDQTEVTNEQFAAFAADTGFVTTAEELGRGYINVGDSWRDADGADWRHPQGPESTIGALGQHPVVQLSWFDAAAFCAWRGARLATEAEWEKAARGKAGDNYPWGDDFVAQNLNFCDRRCALSTAAGGADDGYATTAPSGSYPAGASIYGAQDMAGNVWEWVQDGYEATYYAISPTANPAGPETAEWKVARGGGWNSIAETTRSSIRNRFPPDFRSSMLGFRCAADP